MTMRLTLRTLLAYRDGVLDPKDAAVLEAKIKDSSTAQQISQRIEHEMQNRRLAPIPVDAREFGFEANLVAEFLDDTIPMETLPEMERKCLENNTLLSEIGSCHQILSRALSIPAPISAALRQRIRDLPNRLPANRSAEANGRNRRVDSPISMEATNSKPQSTAVVVSSTKPMRKSNGELRGSGIELHDGLGRQVPEYLIGSDRGWLKSAAVATCLVFALVVVGAIAIGPVDRVRDLLRKSEMAVDANSNTKSSTKKTAATNDDSNSIDTKANADESPIAPLAPFVEPAPIVEPAPMIESVPTVDAEKTSKTTPSDLPKKKAIVDSASIEKPPILGVKNRIQWLPETKASSESIVLKFGTTQGSLDASWKRMSPGEYLNVGERVVVPPAQRTEMQVEPGIRLLCAGENDLELAKDIVLPGIVLHSGRLLVFATSDAQEMEIDCNGVVVSVRFGAADGSCALELQNLWSIFTDAMSQAGRVETQSFIRLFGVEGSLDYSFKIANRAAGGTLAVGQYVDWKNGEATAVQELTEAPWWFRTSINRPIDLPAATDLQIALAGKAPETMEAQLLELTNHRRGETAALAARTRMMLGRYDGLFEPEGVFNRKNLHSHWQSLLAQIPQSLGRDEHRAQLVNAIRTASSNRANSILSLLVPPSQEQLSAGGDKLLVEALSSPMMDERVLAIHQLTNITGKSLGYHPDKNQVDTIQQWRKLLGKNETRYATPTSPKAE